MMNQSRDFCSAFTGSERLPSPHYRHPGHPGPYLRLLVTLLPAPALVYYFHSLDAYFQALIAIILNDGHF